MTVNTMSQYDIHMHNGYCVSFESYESARGFVRDNFLSIMSIVGSNEALVENLIELYNYVSEDFLMEVE